MNISMGTFIAIACQGEVGTGVENTVAPSLSAADYNVGTTITVSLGDWTGATALAGSLRYVSDDTEIDTFTADGTYLLDDADFGQELYLYVVPDGNAAAAVSSAAVGPVSWAWTLRDEFTNAEAAPIASPNAAVPGPGSWTVTTPANLSKAGGVLVRGGAARLTSVATYPRAPLALYARYKNSGTTADDIGLSSNGTSVAVSFFISSAIVRANGTFITLLLDTLHPDSWVDLLIVSRPTAGFLFFVRGANYGRWRLVYVSTTETAADLYAMVTTGAASGSNVDDVTLIEAPSEFSAQYGYALHHEAAPTSPTTGTGDYNMIAEITWTPVAAEIMELSINRVDDNNRVIVRCNQTNSTMALIRKVAGVETSLQSTAQTWTVGTPYRVYVRSMYYGSGVHLLGLVDNTPKLNQPLGDFRTLERATGSAAAGFATAANYAVWPGQVDQSVPFSETGFSWMFTYGDSKTAARRTEARLMTLLEEETGTRWLYDSVGIPSVTVQGMAARVVADLASVPSSVDPTAILINLGSNDVASLPAENTWKANYRTIIEAHHAWKPNATIYLAKPVRLNGTPASTPLAAVATMHGYIDDLIAEYAYVEEGMDETGLENGDGYVTYLSDITHPTGVGYSRCAELWMTALGY
jgi:lysophospholipase L1-like esterase